MTDAWDWTGTHDTPARSSKPPRIPMTPFAEQIAARVKETFYHYVNRDTPDNRGSQATLGPSEIGHGCDRRLAMSLLRVAPVNPSQYDWSSFIGTAVHASLAEMFDWAARGSGRYATEVRLSYDTPHVPRGTTDLIDRVLYMSIDHKVLGTWSLDKFRTTGPPPHYRIQVHTYGLGAEQRGEDIRKVAIIVWPRTKSSLDDLYVWEEDYDPAIGREALARVDRIANQLGVEPIANFPIDNSDCKFCPHYMAGAKTLEAGCNGRA